MAEWFNKNFAPEAKAHCKTIDFPNDAKYFSFG